MIVLHAYSITRDSNVALYSFTPVVLVTGLMYAVHKNRNGILIVLLEPEKPPNITPNMHGWATSVKKKKSINSYIYIHTLQWYMYYIYTESTLLAHTPIDVCSFELKGFLAKVTFETGPVNRGDYIL